MLNPEQITQFAAKQVFEKLNKAELAALNNAVTAGFNPQKVLGYEKVKHLFTEENGTKMHNLIRQVFDNIVYNAFVRLKRVRLLKQYNDCIHTGRIVEAGTEGDAYQFDAFGEFYKVKVKNQPWGDGEITVRTENLEFLEE